VIGRGLRWRRREGRTGNRKASKGRSTVGLAYVTRSWDWVPSSQWTRTPRLPPRIPISAARRRHTMTSSPISGQAGGHRERRDNARTRTTSRANGRILFGFSGLTATTPTTGQKPTSDMFKPHLAEMEPLSPCTTSSHVRGALRVFVEEILDSDDFAQRVQRIHWLGAIPPPRRKKTHAFAGAGAFSQCPLGQLIPWHSALIVACTAGNKFLYKFWRPLAPHGNVSVARLARLIRD